MEIPFVVTWSPSLSWYNWVIPNKSFLLRASCPAGKNNNYMHPACLILILNFVLWNKQFWILCNLKALKVPKSSLQSFRLSFFPLCSHSRKMTRWDWQSFYVYDILHFNRYNLLQALRSVIVLAYAISVPTVLSCPYYLHIQCLIFLVLWDGSICPVVF